MPKFGGLRGGKARKDGLVPGSPEAAAADREKEKLKKQRQRAAKRSDPPPLPPRGPGVPDPAGTVDGVPDGGGAALGGAAVPWQAETLKPVFDQLLPTLEQLTVNQLAGRAEKAKLPPEVVREIERDAKWSAPAMKALQIGCPQLAAKYLNKTGVSSECQPEVVVGTALASIVAGHTLLLRKLDQIIAAMHPKEEPKHEVGTQPKA